MWADLPETRTIRDLLVAQRPESRASSHHIGEGRFLLVRRQIITGIGLVLVVLFICGFFAVSSLVLPACGLNTGFLARFLQFCDARPVIDPGALLALDERRISLERRIQDLEQEISLLQCEPVPVVEPAPPEEDAGEEAEEEALWDEGDVSVMKGCWELLYEYRTRNVTTNVVTTYDDWTLCFPESGEGVATQRLVSTEGVTCESEIPSRFDDAGRIVLEESGNLLCSNNAFIYRRVITCDRVGYGELDCNVIQPEQDTYDTFRMTRRQEE